MIEHVGHVVFCQVEAVAPSSGLAPTVPYRTMQNILLLGQSSEFHGCLTFCFL